MIAWLDSPTGLMWTMLVLTPEIGPFGLAGQSVRTVPSDGGCRPPHVASVKQKKVMFLLYVCRSQMDLLLTSMPEIGA